MTTSSLPWVLDRGLGSGGRSVETETPPRLVLLWCVSKVEVPDPIGAQSVQRVATEAVYEDDGNRLTGSVEKLC